MLFFLMHFPLVVRRRRLAHAGTDGGDGLRSLAFVCVKALLGHGAGCRVGSGRACRWEHLSAFVLLAIGTVEMYCSSACLEVRWRVT